MENNNILTLERADLLEYDAKTAKIKVSKDIFDVFEPNSYATIHFVEDDEYRVFEYSMISEDDEGIVMEYLDDYYQSIRPNRFIENGKFKVRQFSASICDVFEYLLREYDIYIPSEDREGEEDEACLYGDEYSIVEDGVTKVLVKLIEELKKNPDIEIDDEDY